MKKYNHKSLFHINIQKSLINKSKNLYFVCLNPKYDITGARVVEKQRNSSLVLVECSRSINCFDFTWGLQYLYSTSFNVFVRVYLMPLIARLEAIIMEPSIDVETAGRTHTSRPTSFCPLRNFLSVSSVNTLLIIRKCMWNHQQIQIKSSPNTYWIIRKYTFVHYSFDWNTDGS